MDYIYLNVNTLLFLCTKLSGYSLYENVQCVIGVGSVINFDGNLSLKHD